MSTSAFHRSERFFNFCSQNNSNSAMEFRNNFKSQRSCSIPEIDDDNFVDIPAEIGDDDVMEDQKSQNFKLVPFSKSPLFMKIWTWFHSKEKSEKIRRKSDEFDTKHPKRLFRIQSTNTEKIKEEVILVRNLKYYIIAKVRFS